MEQLHEVDQEPDLAIHDGGNITLESLTQFEERFNQIDTNAEETLAETSPLASASDKLTTRNKWEEALHVLAVYWRSLRAIAMYRGNIS